MQQRTGNWNKADEAREVLEIPAGEHMYFRMRVKGAEEVSFEVSTDGEHFQAAGRTVQATPGRWVGVKAGLFALNEQGRQDGRILADYFIFA